MRLRREVVYRGMELNSLIRPIELLEEAQELDMAAEVRHPPHAPSPCGPGRPQTDPPPKAFVCMLSLLPLSAIAMLGSS